ncbi:MAG: hypothetical protein ACLQLG_18680 [Thermoguttaceae bacterium]
MPEPKNHKGHKAHNSSARCFVLFVLFVVPFLVLAGCDLDGPWPVEHQGCWQDAQGHWHCPPPDRQQKCCPDGRGCCPDGPPSAGEGVPGYADVPDSIEQSNWIGPNKSGSCMWAASATMLRWFGQYDVADWWVASHGGGATAEDAAAEARRIGLAPLVCDSGDPAFLDWCDATRRVAAIHYPWIIDGGPKCHAVVFVGWREGFAVLRDDNAPGKEVFVERAHFLEVWQRGWSAAGGGDGRAWTLLLPPAVPRPWFRAGQQAAACRP